MKQLKCQILTLPTNKPNNHDWPLWITDSGTVLSKYKSGFNPKPYHFYLISERPIKENDFGYAEYTKSIFHNRVGDTPVLPINYYQQADKGKKWFKIEASTDLSLGLPLIGQGFLAAYCALNGNVKEVNIEMEEWTRYQGTMAEEDILSPKLREDGIAIITRLKDTWTLDELPINIIRDMLKYCENQAIYDKLDKYNDFYYEGKKWIKQFE